MIFLKFCTTLKNFGIINQLDSFNMQKFAATYFSTKSGTGMHRIAGYVVAVAIHVQ